MTAVTTTVMRALAYAQHALTVPPLTTSCLKNLLHTQLQADGKITEQNLNVNPEYSAVRGSKHDDGTHETKIHNSV